MRTVIVLIVLVGALFLQLAQWLSPSHRHPNRESARQERQVPVEADETEPFQELVD